MKTLAELHSMLHKFRGYIDLHHRLKTRCLTRCGIQTEHLYDAYCQPCQPVCSKVMGLVLIGAIKSHQGEAVAQWKMHLTQSQVTQSQVTHMFLGTENMF